MAIQKGDKEDQHLQVGDWATFRTIQILLKRKNSCISDRSELYSDPKDNVRMTHYEIAHATFNIDISLER